MWVNAELIRFRESSEESKTKKNMNSNLARKISHSSSGIRLVFSRFVDLKKTRVETLVSLVKKNASRHASTRGNFALQHFFEANGISIVFSLELGAKMKETI